MGNDFREHRKFARLYLEDLRNHVNGKMEEHCRRAMNTRGGGGERPALAELDLALVYRDIKDKINELLRELREPEV